jgi:zinc protease
VDNQPYQKAIQDALTMPFDSTVCFAYAHTVIGDMADLDSARVEDVQAFFHQYYAPNNAVLTVVGDFDAAEARQLIAQYYGDIPRVADPPAAACEMRFGTGARRYEMTDDNANLPLVALVYKAPAVSHADAPALELLTSILSDGESGRLNLRLVRGERAALQSGGFSDLRRLAGILIFYAIDNQGVEPARVERLLNEELDRVRNDSIPQAELTKAQNQFRAGAIRRLQTGMGVAETLQNALWYQGSLEEANQDLQRYLAVTTADLHRVAQRYLTPENRLTVIVNPPARGGN